MLYRNAISSERKWRVIFKLLFSLYIYANGL